MRPCETETSRSSAISRALTTPGLVCGRRLASSSTRAATAARYSTVDAYPSSASSRRAAGQRSSGRSPSVKSASVQPAAAPRRAMSSTSSGVRKARSPSGKPPWWAKVQYEHESRQSRVSGMKTFRE